MKNTIIKKMVGCAATSIMLGTLAIGTVFAAGTSRDTLKTSTSEYTTQATTSNPIFTWNGDYSKATATFITEDHEMEVVECDILVSADVDHATYTAVCSYETEDGLQTFKDVKEENFSEMNGTGSHDLADNTSNVASMRQDKTTNKKKQQDIKIEL